MGRPTIRSDGDGGKSEEDSRWRCVDSECSVKILLHSNAPFVATGYGQQITQLAPLLANAGHDVAISAFYGVQGVKLDWVDPAGNHRFPVYGSHLHPYGDDIILGHANHHFGGNVRDGIVIGLIDCWVYNAAQFTRANVAWLVPVDHEPAPPKVIEFFQVSGAVPIAYSRFGERMLKEAGLEPLYAPHTVDTSVFYPHEKKEARKALGLPEDIFLVGMVAANKGNSPSRKGFSQALMAFARFRETHPDARMYIHTELTGVVNGVNLPALMQALKLPGDSVGFCDQYRYAMGGHTSEYMALAYSAMDVLLNPSLGEGFGIPIVEAQSCGTPVIVTDWTAMSELCGAGWKVDGDLLWTEQASFWKLPSVDGIVEALEKAYAVRSTDWSRQAREFAIRYDAQTVFEEYWRPVLASLEERVKPLAQPGELVAA